MIPELLAIDWPARAAWFTLVRGLDDLADRGRRTPCQVDPAPFTSEDRAERAEAAAACRTCPVVRACAAFAHVNRETYVWGAVDLIPSTAPGGSGEVRRAKLERAAADVLDPDEPDKARVERRGPVVQKCEECGCAFVARAKHTRFCSGACRSRVSRRRRRSSSAETRGAGPRRDQAEGRKTAAVRNPPPGRIVVTVTATTVTTRHSEGAAR